MKKLNRLFVLFIGIVILLVSIDGNFVKAEENNLAGNISEGSYEELINEGILDPEISKKQWYDFKAEDEYYAEQQEKEAIDNPDNISASENGEMLRSANAKFTLRKGDFFYTNVTDSKGLTGHSAIYVGNGKIVEALAKGHKTRSQSFVTWKRILYTTLKDQKKENGLKFIDLHQKQMLIR